MRVIDPQALVWLRSELAWEKTLDRLRAENGTTGTATDPAPAVAQVTFESAAYGTEKRAA